MALNGARWAFFLAAGLLLRTYLSVSPLMLLLLAGVAIFVFGSGTSTATGSESFAPINRGATADGMRWGVAAIQGRRPYMEDMHHVVGFSGSGAPNGSEAATRVGLTHFFAVFDGHGGKRAAAWAEEHLVKNLLGALRDESTANAEETLDRACVSAFLGTDDAFLAHARRSSIPDGSTAICCLIQRIKPKGPRRLLVANLGDSRASVVRSNGVGEALSVDHKPNRRDEQARIESVGGHVIFAGCWRVQGDLAVSRAFGDQHLKRFGVSAEPELTDFSLTDADRYIVLASDGLWDVVDEQQCADIVLACKGDVTAASHQLCECASKQGSMDNITALVVDLSEL